MKIIHFIPPVIASLFLFACIRHTENNNSDDNDTTLSQMEEAYRINDSIDFLKIPVSKDSIDLILFNLILDVEKYSETKLIENIQILVSKGANPNAVVEYEYSVRKPGTYIPIIKHFYNNKYRTYIANSTAFHEAVNYGNINIIRKLIDLKADVNAPSRSGIYPVDLAITTDNKIVLELLKENRCDFSLANLSTSKNVETLEWLVKEGANPKSIDINFTLNNRDDLIKVLKLNPDLNNQKLDYVVIFKNEAILDILLDAGLGNETKGTFPDDCPLVFGAIKYGDKNSVLKLKKAGIDIQAECKTVTIQTPLIYAVKQENIEITDFYLNEEKTNPNQKDWTGKSVLHFAIDSDNEVLIKNLIKAGADLEYSGYFNKTPLMYAVDYNNYIAAQVLIDQKADLNFKNKYEETPLSTAIKNNNLPMIKLLTENGVDSKMKINKMTYVEYAKSIEAPGMIIEYLSK